MSSPDGPRAGSPPRFVPLARFLLRAPLLPAAAARLAPGRALLDHPLGPAALALASADLAAGAGDARARAAAVRRYGVRAASRPTPRGLLGGVTVGALGARTRVRTGAAEAHLTVSWARLAALGRALLDEPGLRAGVRVRAAPSLLWRGGADALFLAPGDDAAARAVPLEVDEPLAAVLGAARAPVPWARARAAARGALGGAPDEADELLLLLVDDGLLVHDLLPPLVGPPPLAWMIERLARLAPAPPAAAALARVARALAGAPRLAGDALARLAAEAETTLATLPGSAAADAARPLVATLVHRPRGLPTLSRPAVARAAALAPVLFRLQAALAAPAAERDLDPVPGEALDAVTEVFGAGALDLQALALGDYGSPLANEEEEEEPPPPPAPDAAVVAFLVERLLAAARAGADELALSAAELDAVLPAGAPPATFELFLAPAREPRGAPPGAGWLLGLHAPAGATWGRFAPALGAPLDAALAELAAAEARAEPGAARLDVAWAPSAALADLCAVPAARGRALALSSWPPPAALTPSELELVVDPSASEPLALRARAGGAPVAPSPLHRVRSTTAPAGVYRLLAGWALWRQHAPWALALGPLHGLARLPRVTVEGFVVLPATWRVPGVVLAAARAARDAAGRARARRALARWRREAAVPRAVQVGAEDELLPVDLEAPGAAAELARAAGDPPLVHEVWPPPDRLVDAGGRRLEAVVAVAVEPGEPGGPGGEPGPARAAAASRVADAGRIAAALPVPPPAEAGPAPGWTTFQLFGAADRQDRVLAGAVAPAIDAARRAGELDAWFFQRYVEGPGRREHLRVRARATTPARLERFARRLDAALAPARAAGDVVAVQRAPYLRESARFGGEAVARALEGVFEAESDLVLARLASAEDVDPVELLVAALDLLAGAGLGLPPAERRALARRRRAAHAGVVEDAALAPIYRRLRPRLLARLRGELHDEAAAALAEHARRLRRLRLRGASPALPRGALAAGAPAVAAALHLTAVRLLGPRRALEAAAYVFWERALDSLLAAPASGPTRTPSPDGSPRPARRR